MVTKGNRKRASEAYVGLPQTEILVYSPWPAPLKVLTAGLEEHGWPVYARGNEHDLLSTYREKAFDLQFVIGHSDGRFLDWVERIEDLKERRGYNHFPRIISTRTYLRDVDIRRAKQLGVCLPPRDDMPHLFFLIESLIDPSPENEVYVEIGHECDEPPADGFCLDTERVKYVKVHYHGRTEGINLLPKQRAEVDFLARRYSRYPGERRGIIHAMTSSRFFLNQIGKATVRDRNWREDITRIRMPFNEALKEIWAPIDANAILATLPGHEHSVRFTKNVYVRHFLKSEHH